MSSWAAATPNASISSREDLNVGIIAMRFWAELAYGKSIRGRADQNGRFFRKAIQFIRKNSAESLMIVGHEPDFTKTISALTGASLKLSKAGIALVDVDLSSRKGRLLWLFPPKVAKN